MRLLMLPMTRLLCCVMLALLCGSCTADRIVIFKSNGGAYDAEQSACNAIGGALVEARTMVIVNEYMYLMGREAGLIMDSVAFLGGSRDYCGRWLLNIKNCAWCWRSNWRVPCETANIFYYSGLRILGRSVPGMYSKWASGYPGGPVTQQFLAQSFKRNGFVDAAYGTRHGMSHTLCYITSVIDSSSGNDGKSSNSNGGKSSGSGNGISSSGNGISGSGNGISSSGNGSSGSRNGSSGGVSRNSSSIGVDSSSVIVLPNFDLAVLSNRHGVNGSWWGIIAGCLIATGAVAGAVTYFFLHQNAAKEEAMFEDYDESEMANDGAEEVSVTSGASFSSRSSI